MKSKKTISVVPPLALSIIALSAQRAGYCDVTPQQIIVQADQPGPRIDPRLYGIFFEELDFAGDGGLYAELVNNRSFENDPGQAVNWSLLPSGGASGRMSLESAGLLNPTQTRCLRMDVDRLPSGGRLAVANEGYWGIPVTQGTQYSLSFFARCSPGQTGAITVSLQNAAGDTVYATQTIQGMTPQWKRYSVKLTASGTDTDARLALAPTGTGTVWLDVVSLFPPTYQNRPNGLRPDLVQMLKDIGPHFLRFPGGCYVQGNRDIDQAFDWEKSIGPIEDREGLSIMWGYHTTGGMGFHEMLQMAEDIGAEPVYVANCGQTMTASVPDDQVQHWVERALSAIEYANGPTTSKWGARRAANGHPKPFHMRIISVGNEDAVPERQADYNKHYAIFYKAIKAVYPSMEIVQSVNHVTDAPMWNGQPAEYVDHHFYRSPEWFFSHNDKYDSYSRKEPRVFLSELASLSASVGEGNLWGAIGEAAFMTGLERNADAVGMATYAPLLRNVHWRNWNPNMILFDNHRVYGIPSYYLWQMFMHNTGDRYVPATVSDNTVTTSPTLAGKVGVGTWATQAEYDDLRVVGADGKTWTEGFSSASDPGRVVSGGQWSIVDGTYRQTSMEQNTASLFDGASGSQYTYTLRARKTGGDEGFLILFGDSIHGRYLWNIGGWRNSRSSLMQVDGGNMVEVGKTAPGGIESNRWYEIKVVVDGGHILGYLDGILQQDYTVPPTISHPLFVATNRDTKTGELILKVVNTTGDLHASNVVLNGVRTVAPTGTAIVLTSPRPTDENSFEEPRKVIPTTNVITGLNTSFPYTFPPYSVTVLRIKAK